MDGDTRHDFDVDDLAAVAQAEQRFLELTGKGFTAATKAETGEATIIRLFGPAAEQTVFFHRTRRRLGEAKAMLLFGARGRAASKLAPFGASMPISLVKIRRTPGALPIAGVA
jgi:hypothetical protein